MTVMRISEGGLLAMRNSDFLFGRKFAGNELYMPSFERIMFSATPPTDIKMLTSPAHQPAKAIDSATHDMLTDDNPPQPPPKRPSDQYLDAEKAGPPQGEDKKNW